MNTAFEMPEPDLHNEAMVRQVWHNVTAAALPELLEYVRSGRTAKLEVAVYIERHSVRTAVVTPSPRIDCLNT